MLTDDTGDLPIELTKAIERFERREDRAFKNMGEGGTVGGLAVAEAFLPTLTEAFRKALGRDLDRRYHSLKPELIKLTDETLALCALQTMFHSAAQREPLLHTYRALGTAVAGELWATGFVAWNPRKAAQVAKAAKEKHGRLAYRMTAGRALAAQEGFRPEVELARVLCGEFLAGVAQQALPGVFELATLERPPNYPKHWRTEYCLTLTDATVGIVDKAISEASIRRPCWMPTLQAPKPWTSVYAGGTWDARLQPMLQFVRARQKATHATVGAAIRDGRAKPAVDAVNALQSVPWVINQRVLGVLRECIARGIEVKGLPRPPKDPEPVEDWDSLTEEAQLRRRRAAGERKMATLKYKSQIAGLAEDMQTANDLGDQRFWTPMSLDWRGRVYSVPTFNFQRDDRVRALFLFADGEPIGEDGLYWLKWHVANCGDFSKISKQPFKERVRWTEEHLEQIEELSWNALSDASLSWWTAADKPFLFLAACLELASAIANGPSYITRLPISFDGSCSGLQHLCAMTRAPEGALVNLTPSPLPQDIYQTVADRVAARIAEQHAAETSALSEQWLSYGITRKLVKRNVMTYSYSSKESGMSDQHWEDTMKPLKSDVRDGKLKEHPFGADNGRAACRYLAEHVYAAIEEVIHLPAQAMTFLQQIARALAHEGKPVRWTCPSGLPWSNSYYEQDVKRVVLWMQDRGVTVKSEATYAIGDTKEINKSKSANGVAPNFVHALDAAHLVFVVRAAVQDGTLQLATVHDSFGCLASRAGRFRKTIREQFVALYEQHDPLAEVLEQAKLDLTPDNHHRLPALPKRGDLNIKEVLDAEFAFA